MRRTKLMLAAWLMAGSGAMPLALADEPLDWSPLPVTVTVGHLAAPTRIGEHQVLAYEIRISNDFRLTLKLDKLEVLDEQGLLAAYAGAELAALVQAAQDQGSEPGTFTPGRSTLLFMFLSLPADRAWPATLRHRLHWSWARPGTREAQTQVFTTAALRSGTPQAAVGSPLRGGYWLAANGPANASEHRRTVAYADGVATLPQRYAYDFVAADAQGRLFRSKGEHASDWVGFGQPVLAVADGVVAQVRDGVHDNEPVGSVPPSAMKVRELCGNQVTLRLHSGKYLSYCHLKKDSVKVRAGQAVTQGEELGQLGNSGNSDAPHLHLHLSTQAHPMRGEGEPLPFACHERLGRLADLEAAFAKGRIDITPGPWVSGQAAGMNEIIRLHEGACR